jgi:riboflavin synthase
MFTGIIERCGKLTAVRRLGASRQLTIDLGELSTGTRIGDSIAVNGVCLTVTTLAASLATVDLSAETALRTTLGAARAGTRVNLERALLMGSRLGGHLVSGHVDGVGVLSARVADAGAAGSAVFTFTLPADGSVRVIEKGSLTIDGISLTTYGCQAGRCRVALIPHTLAQTTLGGMTVGSRVNLEQDLVGRWVEELLKPLQGPKRPRPRQRRA